MGTSRTIQHAATIKWTRLFIAFPGFIQSPSLR
jgi:hypothetical protein